MCQNASLCGNKLTRSISRSRCLVKCGFIVNVDLIYEILRFYITGKYGQDFGLIEEDCFQYEGHDAPCKQTSCMRYYTQNYYYIGGFYGACNEPLMRMELVRNGPIAVSFEVYKDFTAYKVKSFNPLLH